MIPTDKRKLINDEQMITFFSGYDFTWRLTKILSIKFLMANREMLKENLNAYYKDSYNCDDQYIYNPVTNGLMFSAVSELLMQFEDFFALLKFIRSDVFFIRNITRYHASNVNEVAERLIELADNEILAAFMIPDENYVKKISSRQTKKVRERSLKLYKDGTKTLIENVKQTTEQFQKYRFFYNQYKHGLTVALRPYSGSLTEEGIQERKEGMESFIISYDNDTFEQMEKMGRLKDGLPMMLPNLTPLIQPHLTELMQEKNLLRYHAKTVNLNDIIEVSKNVCMLNMILINNRLDFIQPSSKECNTIRLPVKGMDIPLGHMELKLCNGGRPLGINRYRREL